MKSRIVLPCSMVLAVALVAAPATAATPAFTEVTDSVGVTMTNGTLPDSDGSPMHGGGTVGDFNNDGWPDLFVVGGGGTNDRLFINDGLGGFTDEAAAWGLTDLYRGNGSTACDFNNDGWVRTCS